MGYSFIYFYLGDICRFGIYLTLGYLADTIRPSLYTTGGLALTGHARDLPQASGSRYVVHQYILFIYL